MFCIVFNIVLGFQENRGLNRSPDRTIRDLPEKMRQSLSVSEYDRKDCLLGHLAGPTVVTVASQRGPVVV